MEIKVIMVHSNTPHQFEKHWKDLSLRRAGEDLLLRGKKKLVLQYVYYLTKSCCCRFSHITICRLAVLTDRHVFRCPFSAANYILAVPSVVLSFQTAKDTLCGVLQKNIAYSIRELNLLSLTEKCQRFIIKSCEILR